MAYCGPHGIALSVFLSWPEMDQQAALMWQAYESSRCSSCATHREDWVDDAGRALRMGRHPQHWHQEVCPGCQSKQRAAKNAEQDADGTRGVVLVAAHGDVTHCPSCSSPTTT